MIQWFNQNTPDPVTLALKEIIPDGTVGTRFHELATIGSSGRDEARKLEADLRSELNTEGAGSIYTSISHSSTPHGTGVIVIGATQRVGVDLESKTRATSPLLGPRILSPSERSFTISPLEAWVAKEAAFKCFYPNQGTLLSQYILIQWNPESQEGYVQPPQVRTTSATLAEHRETPGSSPGVIHFKLIAIHTWLVGLATQRRSSSLT